MHSSMLHRLKIVFINHRNHVQELGKHVVQEMISKKAMIEMEGEQTVFEAQDKVVSLDDKNGTSPCGKWRVLQCVVFID